MFKENLNQMSKASTIVGGFQEPNSLCWQLLYWLCCRRTQMPWQSLPWQPPARLQVRKNIFFHQSGERKLFALPPGIQTSTLLTCKLACLLLHY